MAVLACGAAAGGAEASTIVTGCDYGVCAVDPETGSQRAVIKGERAATSASEPTISADGRTIMATTFQRVGSSAVYRLVRLAATADDVPAADTAALQDVRPPQETAFSRPRLGSDASVFSVVQLSPFAEQAKGNRGGLRVVRGAQEVQLTNGLSGPAFWAGSRFFYSDLKPGDAVLTLCELTAAAPCEARYRPPSREVSVLDVSSDGRRALLGTFKASAEEVAAKVEFPVGKDSTVDLLDLATGKVLRRVADGAGAAVFSPDDRQVAYADLRSATNTSTANARLMVVPTDGALGPRQVGRGGPSDWGGPMPTVPSGPPVRVASTVRASSLGRGMLVRVSSLKAGTRVRIQVRAGSRVLGSTNVRATATSIARRVRLGATARAAARRAGKVTVRVLVADKRTDEVVRVR